MCFWSVCGVCCVCMCRCIVRIWDFWGIQFSIWLLSCRYFNVYVYSIEWWHRSGCMHNCFPWSSIGRCDNRYQQSSHVTVDRWCLPQKWPRMNAELIARNRWRLTFFCISFHIRKAYISFECLYRPYRMSYCISMVGGNAIWKCFYVCVWMEWVYVFRTFFQ